MRIGFIGQGWIGKNYADDFERRGFEVVRYALEEPYKDNRGLIPKCDIVFIAVPTPTTKDGFDARAVDEAVFLVGEGKIAVIKSTILPGIVESMQKKNEGKTVLHSPEFLSEATAKKDSSHPVFNIIGMPFDNTKYRKAAEDVMGVLPRADFSLICLAREAELFKYLRNCFFYTKVVYMNLLYDLAERVGADWGVLREILAHDPWVGGKHLDPMHKSGRGAGGNCFIKDFAALARLYENILPNDADGAAVFKALEKKNAALLQESGKDLDKVIAVYGIS